uniref:Insulin-like growth factor 1 n=1 Tax=Hucho hucho TaxID=62062 RepID=A0A4W5KB41_9TELE
MLFTCSLHALYMFFACFLHALYMLSTCSLHALYMLFTCSLHALYKLSTCSLHALCMLFTCSSHVVTQILLSVSPGQPTGYGPSSRRSHNRGIVDECCFQSCELRRLEMYCAPVKSGKAARSVRAQRHTDMPRTPKVSTAVQNVDRGTERRTAQHPDKTKTKKEVHQKNSSRGNTGGRNYRM